MKKTLLISIILVASLFGADNNDSRVKTPNECSQERYYSLKKFVAENPDSPAVLFLMNLDSKCQNLKK